MFVYKRSAGELNFKRQKVVKKLVLHYMGKLTGRYQKEPL